MPDNRDRRRASLSPGQVILVIMAIFVLLIFAWGLHSINSPALVCAVRPANMRVKNEERVGNPKREYRASGCNDGGVLPHSKCRQARPYRVANQPSATAMIQITPVMATTALMPVSFHMMFTARSPEAATRNYRNRASQP